LAFVGEGGWVKYLISGGILFIALMMIRLGGRVLFAQRVVRFEDSDVIVTERGLLGRRESRAAYKDFKGIGVRRFYIAQKGAPKRAFHAVELQHDEAEAIALLVVEGTDAPHDAQEIYARVLGVPLLRDDIADAPDDLDYSLVERLDADAYIGSDWTAPPKGLVVESRDNCLAVTLPPMITKLLLGLALLLLLVVIFMSRAFGTPIWIAIFGFIPLLVLAWMDRRHPRSLEISSKTVRFEPGVIATKRVKAATLSLAHIKEVRPNTLRGLSITSDDNMIITGPGLRKDMQKWLEQYIQTAIATT